MSALVMVGFCIFAALLVAWIIAEISDWKNR